jgi:hypothetical protein
MKVGIEEEFLVIDPDTLFYTPAAPRLANKLVYKNKDYIKQSSVELPLNSGILKFIKQAKKGYCVIEIKTKPFNEIDKLKNELDYLRKELIDVAEENGIYLIPTGIHPMFIKDQNFSDNCAALHIHIQGTDKKMYNRILGNIPFLISISANSPFFEGRIMAMSSRAQISNHISLPKNYFDRESDLLINKSLKTIEIRILDTQITTDETIGLTSIYRTIAQNDLFYKNITREEYNKQRQQSILKGKSSITLNKEQYDLLKSINKYSKELLDIENGSDWQIKIYKKYGLGSVIQSLWESFRLNKRTIRTTTKDIDIENIKKLNLLYFIPYFPFFMIEKIKKYFQDITPVKNIKQKEDVFDDIY